MTEQRKYPLWSGKAKGVVLVALLGATAAIIGQGCPPAQTTPDPNAGLTGDFVGSERCFTCHSRTHDEWIQTRHAQAYDDLVELGQETNSVCLTCHTTGFGKDGGFQSASTTLDLASVGCESCHGASGAHVRDVSNRSLRPPVSMSADWCGQCHNGFHHDLYSEWASSGHAAVTESVAEELFEGTVATSCGVCHSGDVRKATLVDGETITDALLSGVHPEDQNAVACAVCHDPHAITGNAISPLAGHDRQLRYAEVKYPEPTNVIASTMDPNRFNLCGQCHHSRGRDWTSNSRGPHHSVQSNVYFGEMPTPAGQEPLVPNQNTTHRFVAKQCVTCHMQLESPLNDADPDSSIGDTHVGHIFVIESYAGCVASGCHPTAEATQSDTAAIHAEVQGRLDALKARMGAASTWQYSSTGGPAASAQSSIPVQVRKVRFLMAYIESDGSLGVHNPPYIRSMLTEAEDLLTEAGL